MNLSGVVDSITMSSINDMVQTRFVDRSKFKTPEALIIWEQKMLPQDQLFQMCNDSYEDVELREPSRSYVPTEYVDMFRKSMAVPVRYMSSTRTLYVAYVPEYTIDRVQVYNCKVEYVPTTIYYYFEAYTRVYGDHPELLPIPGKQALDMILNEAIKQGVPDLTISSLGESVIVYYNKKKRKVMGNNIFSKYIMGEIIKVLTFSTPISDTSDNRAKYVGYEIDSEYRARVVINKNVYGYVITIRLFSQAQFDATMEDLNLNEEVIEMFRDKEIQAANGLRLIVGETMSGKNTTALAILREIVKAGDRKVVSIEMPVEQRLDGVEQIPTEFIEEYVSNIESLIHQNPDFVYITETKDETGLPVMRIANTGKRVLTTLHSNSVADTISRLSDITGMSSNRIIQVLHSIVHQELVRIGDEVYPKTTFVVFDDALKLELYDKPFGEIIRIISSRVRGGFKHGIQNQ